MLSRIREHLGGAGLVVAVVALVVALAGGAIAANGGSGDGKATASAKAKKGPRGPKGPKGDTGPAGPAGPAGAKGDSGAAGSNGSNGADGKAGATGATGLQGIQGIQGIKGATGPTGPTGSSSFTATLPVGETETGAWGQIVGSTGFVTVPVSFNIPLAAPLDGNHVISIAEANAEKLEKCDDGVSPAPSASNPEADPGYLCIYTGSGAEAQLAPGGMIDPALGSNGASTSGALLIIVGSEAEGAAGTFAVTGGP